MFATDGFCHVCCFVLLNYPVLFVFDLFFWVDMQQIICQHLLTLLRYIRSNLSKLISIHSSAPPRSMSMAGSSTLCNVGVDHVKSFKAFIYEIYLEERAEL